MNDLRVISVHPIHYNDYLFYKLQEAGISLNVHYTKKALPNYPWKRTFSYSFEQRHCHYFLGIDWTVIRQIINERSSVFIVSGWDTFFKNVVFLFLIFLGRKYVVYTDTYNEHLKRNYWKATMRSSWLRFVFSKADKIFTTGQVGVDILKNFYNDPKIVNFPFATDLNCFNATPDYSNFLHEKIILSSGRLLNEQKGHDIAIKALAILKQKGYNFKYYIAGAGPDKVKIEKLIQNCDLEDRVFLLGWQEVEELRELYKRSHVFLHASHFDPFPNSILEAMASGLVVVASDAAGSAMDRIEHGKSGFIFPESNIDSLAATLEHVLNMQPSGLVTISTAAKEVSKKWDVSYNVAVVKELVNS